MPKGDGTGPKGEGPRAGKARDGCNPQKRGCGRGQRRGQGSGQGRGQGVKKSSEQR